MAHTFWHSGILIGESDLEESSDHPRQRGGVFRPTAYGLEVFPRLTGILSAGHALKTHLEANGLSPEEMEGSEIDELLDTTAAGRKIIDIGRMLSEVEMRAPDGRRLEFASIAFSDLLELQRLMRELGVGDAGDLRVPPTGGPRYIVSATLSDKTPASRNEPHAGRGRRRRWEERN
jgi:hypothetical protein